MLNECRDVTYIIPIKIDSVDRIKNLYIVISFINKFFNSNIVLVEQDNNICEENIAKKFDNIEYISLKINDGYIHKCQLINAGIKAAKTPIVAIQDGDVIANPEQYMQSINDVRNCVADCSLPYNHKTLQIKTKDVDKLFPDFDFEFIKTLELQDITPAAYNGPTIGGILFFDKNTIVEAGMYNENFKGWGNEDDEVYYRFGKLGYTHTRPVGDIYHFNHYREPSKTGYAPGNRDEYLRIVAMKLEELQKEISNWNWIKGE